MLGLWLCWDLLAGFPAKGLEASEYLYTVHTAPSQTLPRKDGPLHPGSPSLVPEKTANLTSSSSRASLVKKQLRPDIGEEEGGKKIKKINIIRKQKFPRIIGIYNLTEFHLITHEKESLKKITFYLKLLDRGK